MSCVNGNFPKSVQHPEKCLLEPVSLYAGIIGENVTLQFGDFNPNSNDGITQMGWYFKCPNCGVWDQLGYILFCFSTKRIDRDDYLIVVVAQHRCLSLLDSSMY